MEDNEIIDLFCNNSESAIVETVNKYGRYIYLIGLYVTGKHEDAEECLNDSLFILWRKIPLCRPMHLKAYIQTIAYHVALGRMDYYKAAKRNIFIQESFEDSDNYIKNSNDIEAHIEKLGIINAIKHFYENLPREKQLVFNEKYEKQKTIEEISYKYGMSQSKIKMMLFRMRKELKQFLEEENIYL